VAVLVYLYLLLYTSISKTRQLLRQLLRWNETDSSCAAGRSTAGLQEPMIPFKNEMPCRNSLTSQSHANCLQNVVRPGRTRTQGSFAPRIAHFLLRNWCWDEAHNAIQCSNTVFYLQSRAQPWRRRECVSPKRWCVRFQVLTAASMMFRIVFWDVLPCKIIVDNHFTRQYIPEDNSER
jgi:hypothetical protein